MIFLLKFKKCIISHISSTAEKDNVVVSGGNNEIKGRLAGSIFVLCQSLRSLINCLNINFLSVFVCHAITSL